MLRILLLWVSFTGQFLIAQETAPVPPPPVAAAVYESNDIRVVMATVFSKDSAEVVTTEDFELKENGKEVIIAAVRNLARPPIHYCVVFDISKSEQASFSFQQEEAGSILARIIRPGVDRGWITFFNDEARESTETGDPRQIQSLILQMIPKGGTSLYDSVAGCARRMEKNEGSNRQELRAMFLFTDGDDDASKLTLNEALNAVEAGNLRLFAFAPQLELNRRGKRALEKFTESTGGRLFVPGNTKGLEHAITQIEQDLDNLLEISYISRLNKAGMPTINLKSRKKGVSVLAPGQTAFTEMP